MPINRHNFILYLSGTLGVFIVLAAVFLLAQWVTREPTQLASEAGACSAQYTLKRLTPCPVGNCQDGSSQIIYQDEENVQLGLFLDTQGETVVAASTYLNFTPSDFSSFDVANGDNGFSEPIIDVGDGVAQLHHFSLDGVVGSSVHLATVTVTPGDGVTSFNLGFDYQGCGSDGGSIVVAESGGNILADPGTTAFLVQPVPTDVPTATPTVTPTATPVPTATSTPTPTATPTNTPTPTPSPVPTATSTPVPTDQPSPTSSCLNEIDYNCDGKISAVDFQNWVSMFRGYVIDGEYDTRADLNNDGKISALDFPPFVQLWRANQ